MKPRTSSAGRVSGQALTEFVVMAAMMSVSIVILSLFLWTFKQFGGRILGLVASEFP